MVIPTGIVISIRIKVSIVVVVEASYVSTFKIISWCMNNVMNRSFISSKQYYEAKGFSIGGTKGHFVTLKYLELDLNEELVLS